MGFEVAVDGIVDDVGPGAHKPLEERLVRVVEHLVPFLKPVEFIGLVGPKALQILAGFFRKRIPIFQDRL